MIFLKTYEQMLLESDRVRIKNHIFNFIKSVLETIYGFEVTTKESYKLESGAVTEEVPKYYCDFLINRDPKDWVKHGSVKLACGCVISFYVDQKTIGTNYFLIKYSPTSEVEYYEKLRSIFNFMKAHKRPLGEKQSYVVVGDGNNDVTEISVVLDSSERIFKDITLSEFKKYANTSKFDL